MTDKQIIIDGVDVSGCKNFRPDVETTQVNYTNACSIGVWQRWYTNLEPSCIMSCSCKYNPNCDYKQLKSKEQECEELRKEKAYTDMACEQFEKQLKAKEQECEELKKINKANAKSYEKHWYKLEKYKQTLTEIKEIAEEKANVNDWLALQILQKISECEGNDDR